MKLNAAKELKQPGKISKFHAEEALEGHEYLGRELVFAAPLTVDAEYFFDGEGFSIKGTISTKLNSECALCGKPFVEPFSCQFDERFVTSPVEGDECYGYRGEELDISQMVLDNLFLNLPAFSKCREDCKGLCPLCGCDLNTEQCSCAGDSGPKSPFAALETLLYHDKEV